MSSIIGGTTGITFPDSTVQTTAATTPTAVANLSGGAAGVVPYQTGSGATSFTAAGTSGQVLTSAGTGTPTWSTPSAGAMTLISTQSLAGKANITWTGLSGYGTYMIVWNGVESTSTSDDIFIYIGYGSTTYVTTSNYYAARAPNSGACYGYNRTDGIYLGTTVANSFDLSGSCIVSGGTVGTHIGFTGNCITASLPGSSGPGGMYFSGNINISSHPITAFQFLIYSGSLTAGSATLYGITS